MRLPRSLKLIYTLFIVAIVPPYVVEHGWGNFLWFSNIALLLTTLTLWLESPRLASMMTLAVLIPEIGWNIDFFVHLIFGIELLGLAAYMFDPQIALIARLLSLYHVPLPILLIWLVYRLGYDPAALWAQTLLAWLVLPTTWLVTEPANNVNWVYGPGAQPQAWTHPLLWLMLMMIAYPLLFHLPVHMLLRRWFRINASAPHAGDG